VVEEQSALAIQKKHQLELSTSDNLSPIFGDDIKLKRALTNLAVNALNYTPDGGRICVRTFKENGHVAFEVQDNGIGVDEKELPYIFERLYRSEKSRAMHKGGTGLGLAIVKKIVETHAGRIEVESKKGEGSRFVVWLPIHPRANK
jgi:signal transduction histidine kinase